MLYVIIVYLRKGLKDACMHEYELFIKMCLEFSASLENGIFLIYFLVRHFLTFK